jgi:hypothetical protein
MARSRDYIPVNDAQFSAWYKTLTQYVGLKTGAGGEWTHIPKAAVDELCEAYADFYTHYSLMLKPHTKAETAEKNAARKRAEKVIRPFVRQYLTFKPITPGDRISMGLPVLDETRTPQPVPTEMVEFYFKLPGPRQIAVHFKVLGAVGKAKPAGYDGALIVWAVLDKPPADSSELTSHVLATRTPRILKFKDSERGKTVYVAICWQNAKGDLGPLSEIQSAIVP